ncbi:MFS transporter [Verminephrobacter aporrectodeae]|uniref:hypothetical protein n=1 Tax=Verminephrobacter aporrectodeae TaxID=1110389 RepID=UPI00223757A2|nr:hypothetical protein [Verminephrobacter aporrectodeae]
MQVLIQCHVALFIVQIVGHARLSPALYGLMQAAGAASAMFVARRTSSRSGLMRLLATGLAAMALSWALASAAGLIGIRAGLTAAAAAGSFAAGAFLYEIAMNTLRLRDVPSALRGRVVSAFRVCAYLIAPLGGVVAAAAADRFGLSCVFIVMATLAALVAVSLARSLTTASLKAAPLPSP